MQTPFRPRTDISYRLQGVLSSKLPHRVDAWEELRDRDKVYCASIEHPNRTRATLIERATFRDLCVDLVVRGFCNFRPRYKGWLPPRFQPHDHSYAAVCARPDPYAKSVPIPFKKWSPKSAKSSHHR